MRPSLIKSWTYDILCTNYKPTLEVQTQRQQNNIIVIVSRWDNSQASLLFTALSNQICIVRCHYVCFGLLMQIALEDYSAYLYEITYTYIISILVSVDLFRMISELQAINL